MRMSAKGRNTLALREGVRLKAYTDTVGVLTIGVGHTSKAGPPTVTPGLTITKAECDAIFARDLVQYENAVNDAVKVPVSQNSFDAMVSFCFNVGPASFARSTIVKRLNGGDVAGAGDAFLLWNKPPEIVGRRRSERAQFLEPDPKAVPQAAPPDIEPPPVKVPPAPPAPLPPATKQKIGIAGVLSALWVAATAGLQSHPFIIGGGVFAIVLAFIVYHVIRKG